MVVRWWSGGLLRLEAAQSGSGGVARPAV